MINKSKIVYYIQRCVELLFNPYSLYIKYQGGIADLYIRLNKPWFYRLKIDTLFDIGGNIGLFSKTIRLMLPEVKIYAFEPLPDCYLNMNMHMDGDGKYEGFNCGLGEKLEILFIEKSIHSPSSSFLKMGPIHRDAFPQTSQSQRLEVPVKRLDDLAKNFHLGQNIMIKVDVQGFEDKVIKGGMETFKKAKLIIIELSYRELYIGQPLFDDVYQQLVKIGFEFHGVMAQMPDPDTLDILDADCIFIRK